MLFFLCVGVGGGGGCVTSLLCVCMCIRPSCRVCAYVRVCLCVSDVSGASGYLREKG